MFIFWLIVVLFIKAFLMGWVILHGDIHLSPDEAQYWTWSQALDWGYYSKPPGIAWQIWMGTHFFGSSEFGVRFISILFSFGQAILVYYLALTSSLKERTAFYCGLMMALCPIGILGSLLATTDGGFLLFWTLACVLLAKALNEQKKPNPYLIGLTIALGSLFKWPIYLFWLFYVFMRNRYFSHQSYKQLIIGIAISLLGLLPSLWWNWHHDWATFKHVSTAIAGGNAAVIQGNFWEFLGSQILLFSPILFGLFVSVIYVVIRERKSLPPPLFFCATVSIAILFFVTLLSFFQKIQGNWSVFVYPTAIVLIGWYTLEKTKKLALILGGIALSIVLVGYILALPSLTSKDSGLAIPFKLNPFKHNVGWDQLADILEKTGYNSTDHYLFSDKYQTTSLLSFYSPQQKMAYFFNLQNSRNNQFSYWPQLQDKEKGKGGYFIWIENAPYLQKDLEDKPTYYGNELRKYFLGVQFLGYYPLIYQNGQIVKGMMIFKCIYQYSYPGKSQLY